MRRSLPLAALVAVAVTLVGLSATTVASAEYVAPQGEAEPEVSPGTPKPGKRKFYLVEVEEVERPKRNVTLTFDPLELLFPIFQMHADFRVGDDFAVGLIGGYGQAKVDALLLPNEPLPPKAPLWQVGAKATYFAQGDFEGGMHVGLEAVYTHAKLEGRTALGTGSVSGLAAGLIAGPIVGWKLVTKAGFTFDSAIGVGLIAYKQKSSDPDAPKDDRAAVLMSHLLIGWSF